MYDRSRTIAEEAAGSLLEGREPACGDAAGQRIAERLRDRDYLVARTEERRRFRSKEAFAALLRGERQRSRRRLLARIGAAACLTVAAGMAGWWGRQPEGAPLPSPSPVPDACRIEARAVLIKGDGEQVVLGGAPLQTREGSGTAVAIDSAGVAYTSLGAPQADTAVCNTLLVPRGGMYTLTLCDGTRVWVNADSRLEYPVAFPEKRRAVRLSGEAYFEVAKAEGGAPFIVETERGSVTVTGTEFNVKCYADEAEIATTLVEGKVSFAERGGEGEAHALRPGEQAVWREESGATAVRKVNVAHYIGWKNNRLSFQGERLEDIMRTLARWFNTETVFEDEGLKSLVFSGSMEKFSELAPMLRLFELGSEARFELKDRTVYVSKRK